MTSSQVRQGVSLVLGAVVMAFAGATSVQAQLVTFESSSRVPADIEALTHLFETRDPVKFLNDRAKPLNLTKVQRDSLKKLQQGLNKVRRPLLKRLERELPEMRLPGQQLEIGTLPTATRALVDSLMGTTDNYGQLAWSQLDEAQQAQALELRASWTPPVYTPERRAFRVDQIGPP